MNSIKRFKNSLFIPFDAFSLSLFRILFGALLGWHVLTLMYADAIAQYYVKPAFHFTYPLFDFLHLKPLSFDYIYAIFKIMGVTACTIALGMFCRISLIVFLLTSGYIFLLDKAYYTDSSYLALLIAGLLVLTKAHRCLSFDALRDSKTATQQVPFWNILLLRIQVCLVFFFQGIAKINTDYLQGNQIQYWLTNKMGSLHSSDLTIQLFSYTTIILEISIGLFLCLKRTRPFALLVAIIYLIWKNWLLSAGVLDYLLLITLIVFLDPKYPRFLINRFFEIFEISKLDNPKDINNKENTEKKSQLIFVFITIYIVVQILIPLRHFAYPGDVNWTQDGQRFAWRDNINRYEGRLSYAVYNGLTDKLVTATYFEELVRKQYFKLVTTPDLIKQYAKFLKVKYKKRAVPNPKVTARGTLSINGHPPKTFIDESVNLAEEKKSIFSNSHWVLDR